MKDAQGLLNRVKAGGHLSSAELTEVRAALKSPREVDPYTLIHILWKSRDQDSRDLLTGEVHHGLDDPDDDGMVRRLALQAIADLWPDEGSFHLIERTLQNDPRVLVRLAAASALGDVGRHITLVRGDAARILLEGFHRTGRDPLEREAYYEGLLNLLGVPENARPLATRPLTPDDMDAHIFAAAADLATPK